MEKIYFNNAASSWPKAPGLGQVLARAAEEIPSHPGRTGYAVDSDHMLDCRQQIASLLSVDDPRRIVLSQSATFALNMALLGFPFRRGDWVVTTAQDHNSVLRPLYYLRRQRRIRLQIVPVDGQGRVDADEVLSAIETYQPRMVAINHASNVTGALQPVREIFAFAKAHGAVTLLDASQSLGLEPISVGDVLADIVAFTGHKYLLGPTGTGGMYVSPDVELKAVFTGGTGVCSDLKGMPEAIPGRLEPGTPNVPAFAGLSHALAWQASHPLKRDYLDRLCLALEQGLQAAGARVVQVSGPRTPVVSFTLPGWKVSDAGYALQSSFGLICRYGLHCAPLVHAYLGTDPHGTLRFSLSRFNTPQEVDYAIAALQRLLA